MKCLSKFFFFLIGLSVLLLCFSGAFAQGLFRERIKERIRDRIGERGSLKTSSGDCEKILLNVAGAQRFYLVHAPRAYRKGQLYPLILAFHGGGGDSELMAKEEYYHWISKADKEGFIVAFPNGASRVKSGKLATWNAGNCCGYARDEKFDDVDFVREVIRDIQSRFNVDSKKIFATGMSNGGMMSYRLACEMSDTFAAIASVAGTDNYDACQPYQPISIMHIHAKDDGHVLFNGGAGKEAFNDLSKVTDFTSVPETISRWVKRNSCSDAPKRVMEEQGVYCDVYSGCEDGVQVKLCVTETGGHSWPGGETPRKKAAVPTDVISAVDEIWDFFKNSP